jgi:iron-sulfur cluster protein/radical SAM family protein
MLFWRKKQTTAFHKRYAAGGGVLDAPVPEQPGRWCHWPFRAMVLTSDGDVVCGCADPFKQNPLGSAREQSLLEIWNGPGFQAIRAGVNDGSLSACGTCQLYESRPVPEPPASPLVLERGPTRLFVEPSIVCNISCHEAVCNQENGIELTRRTRLLDVDLFKKAIDELGPGLERLEFYNYGESFVNPRSYEMIAYAKSRFPGLFVYASSNGLLFDRPSRREALLRSGLDEIVFSVDGARPDSYARYRVKGDFHKVIHNLRECVDLKRRLGLTRPQVIWRYILFRWNDSDDEMREALELAREIGVDRFYWEITDHPPGAPSLRFRPGSSEFEKIRHQVWGWSHLGMRARLRCEKAPRRVRAGESFSVRVRARNESHDPWAQDHPLHKEFVRLGVQLLDRGGIMLQRDWSRHFLPRHEVRPGEEVSLELTLQAPAEPGRYRLRVDPVLEGVTWFADVGSRPLELKLKVLP